MARLHLSEHWAGDEYRGACGTGSSSTVKLTNDPGEVTCLSCQKHIEDEMKPIEEVIEEEALRKARMRARSRAVSELVDRHAEEFETLWAGFTAELLDLADGAKVPKDEAVRIVDELVARGWTKAVIARQVGSYPGNLLRGPTIRAGTLRALRRLLDEPVPLRKHNPTGRLYRANPDYRPRPVPATTHGVPEDFTPGSSRWLAVMRLGLKQAVEASIRRHGKVAA